MPRSIEEILDEWVDVRSEEEGDWYKALSSADRKTFDIRMAFKDDMFGILRYTWPTPPAPTYWRGAPRGHHGR